MSLREAAIAANRFGLGATPTQLNEIASDPRGWLLEQIHPAPTPIRELAGMKPSGEIVRNRAAMRGREDEEMRRESQMAQRELYRGEMAARCLVAARSRQPFRERLVRFWSNHFSVSVTRGELRGLVGAYEREAIRPNICAGFTQLLLAAERHPAMQLYLDNARSIGPDSMAGSRSGKGLNENHAREILELHTLGVNGGYTQEDVEALAAILTGWGLVRGRDEIRGGFAFEPRRHQPGTKRLLGRDYPEDGEREGRAALKQLARHPATARFIATKLVRHFVADEAPEAAVDPLTRTFLDSGGDLPEVYRALIALPQAWDRTLSKLKTPDELVVSTARALGYVADGEPMLRSVLYLGQPPFAAPSPQGWPDQADDWLGPESVLTRVEWAQKVGEDTGHRIDRPDALAASILGPLLTSRTHDAVRTASTPSDALALLMASPEFQRR